MARQKHPQRGDAPGGSQRQLRVGELIRHAIVFFAVFTTPALAEVCDKVVGDSWQPGHGAVWILNPSGFPSELLLLLSGLLLVAAAKNSILGYVGAALTVGYTALLLYLALGLESDIYRLAVREGCRSHSRDVLHVAALILFALAFAWLGYRSRSAHAKAH
jgi:hypothetical protein